MYICVCAFWSWGVVFRYATVLHWLQEYLYPVLPLYPMAPTEFACSPSSFSFYYVYSIQRIQKLWIILKGICNLKRRKTKKIEGTLEMKPWKTQVMGRKGKYHKGHAIRTAENAQHWNFERPGWECNVSLQNLYKRAEQRTSAWQSWARSLYMWRARRIPFQHPTAI